MTTVDSGQITSSAKLYIGNLDPRVTEYHIINLFKPYGTIIREEFAWHTHGHRKGEPRGFCFIEFSLKEEAITAKEKLQGKLLLNRPLAIHFANEKDKLQGEKGKPVTPNEKDNDIVSKQSMDARIFAIKTKLKLMEKTVTPQKFEPYPSKKPPPK